MYSNKDHLYALDTLKGIMIFSIVLYHMPRYMRGFMKLLGFFYKYGGDVGNTLFFMLSGLIICYVYEDKVNELTLRSFIRKRVLSVYAIYLITGVVSLAYSIKNNGIAVLNIRDLSLNLLMITSGWVEDIYPYNSPTWFFSALLLDYVIWFVVSKYGKNKRWYIYIFMIILGLAIQKAPLKRPFLYYHTGEALAPFFEGCVFYKLWNEKKEQGKRFFPEITILCCLLVVSVIVTHIVGFDAAVGTWKYAWYVVYVPLIIMSILDLRPLNSFFENKVMVGVFGNISKYVFFWHVPFYSLVGEGLLKMFPDSANARCIGYLIALYAFCTISRLIEKSVKRRWRENFTWI